LICASLEISLIAGKLYDATLELCNKIPKKETKFPKFIHSVLNGNTVSA